MPPPRIRPYGLFFVACAFIFNYIERKNRHAVFGNLDEVANFDSVGTRFDFFILGDDFEVGIGASEVGNEKMIEFAIERKLEFAKGFIEKLAIKDGKKKIEISVEPLVVIDENGESADGGDDGDGDEENLKRPALFVIKMLSEKFEQPEKASDVDREAATAKNQETSGVVVDFNRDTIGQKQGNDVKESECDERELLPEFEFLHFPPLTND